MWQTYMEYVRGNLEHILSWLKHALCKNDKNYIFFIKINSWKQMLGSTFSLSPPSNIS